MVDGAGRQRGVLEQKTGAVAEARTGGESLVFYDHERLAAAAYYGQPKPLHMLDAAYRLHADNGRLLPVPARWRRIAFGLLTAASWAWRRGLTGLTLALRANADCVEHAHELSGGLADLRGRASAGHAGIHPGGEDADR